VIRTIATALLVLCGAAMATAEETAGTVAALEGAAEATHAGGSAAVRLKAGDAVLLGDRLRTAKASKLKLLFRDDSVLTLAANSELIVDQEVVGPASATASHSVVGTVRAVVTDRYKTPGSSFEVETPTAVAGVRGTSFFVRYNRRQRLTTVIGLSGVVCVRPRQKRPTRSPVCIHPQQYTEVKAGGAPTAPAPVDQALLETLVHMTEILDGGIVPESEIGPTERFVPGIPGAAGSDLLAAPVHPDENAFPNRDHAVDQPVPQLKALGNPTTQPTAPPPPPPPPPPPQAAPPRGKR
jgi:ferric-dicitrate binding protein FerR (iron transport regulator)